MKKKLLFLALSALLIVSCGTTKKTASNAELFKYDLEYVKTGGHDMSIVKVWSYGQTAKQAEEKCRADAVHGVLFKGYSGQGISKPAMVKGINGYEENKEFFDKFFNSGDYLRYVSAVVDGSTETRKVQGGGYKVSSEISVNVRMLRKHLEEAGIIKRLGYGF
ncbi:MAG: hypothetical protein J5764_06185 [Bacteroidales bacterium]|nr:hypothetical protein [Bacteroidales bacterium]